VGAATLAVLWSEVGDPVVYSSAGADVKALGLNLKERSNGMPLHGRRRRRKAAKKSGVTNEFRDAFS